MVGTTIDRVGQLFEVLAHDHIIELIEAGDQWGAAQATTDHTEGGVFNAVIDWSHAVDPKAIRYQP